MRVPEKSFRALLFIAGLIAAVSWSDIWADAAQSAPNLRFSETLIRIEFNSTDEDIGIQIFLDADAWREVRVLAPNGNRIFEVQGRGRLRGLGLTELFFESEEPELEELPLDEFLALFPEGEYKFFGTTAEGEELVGSARLNHRIPDGPGLVSPKKGQVVNRNNVLINWNPVTTPENVRVVRYQVIVEGDNPLRVFSIDLPAAITSVKVPPSFFDPGKRYKVEVLAIEAGGNQTISERSFRVE